LQTSDALGAAASQVGPDAQAAATVLHTQAGLSHGKVAAVFDTLFGIDLTRGASAQINLRAAHRLEPDYRALLDELPTSEQIAADETGWRIGGQSAWLHVWVGERATAYAIDPRRSAAVLEEVLGADWDGILGHDGFASYERFTEAIHQQCVAHPLRRARDLLAAATRGAVHFPRQVIALFTAAVHERNRYRRGELTPAQLEGLRDEFDDRLLALARPRRAVAEYERLAQHLWDHSEQWFTFLTDPTVEATNWQAEQAIRPAVVNRKVWGGNRTPAGAKAQSILMSVLETCRRQTRSTLDYVSHTLRSFGNLLLPRPVLLPTR
jgi:transposase